MSIVTDCKCNLKIMNVYLELLVSNEHKYKTSDFRTRLDVVFHNEATSLVSRNV